MSFVLIYYLITFIEFGKINAALKNANKLLLFSAFLLLPLNLFFQYKKWEVVCNSLLKISDKKKIGMSLFLGITGGLFTPLQTGEYLSRSIPFGYKSIVPTSIATAVDKFFPMALVLIVGSIVSLPYVSNFFTISIFSMMTILTAVLFFAALVFKIVWKNKNAGLKIKLWLGKFNFINKIKLNLQTLKSIDGHFVRAMIVFSFLFVSTFVIQYILLTSALTNYFEFPRYLLFVILVLFVKTIIPPITIGEIGVREAVSVYLGAQFAIPDAAAFNVAIIIFFINLLIPSAIGLVLFFMRIK